MRAQETLHQGIYRASRAAVTKALVCTLAVLAATATPAFAQHSELPSSAAVVSTLERPHWVAPPDSPAAILAGSDGTLSLEHVIAEVLARNPSIEQATHALNAALERPAQARALDDPMLSYMIGPGTIGSSDFDFGQKFEASQSFPWPGKRRLRGEAAELDAESLRGDLDVVREELAYATRMVYLELWLTDRAIEINGTNQNLLTEFEEIAQRKYAAGIVPKQDALQARVEREMLVHDGTVLVRMRNRAIARVNALLNQPTDASLPSPPTSLRVPVPPAPLAALQAAAEMNRPEMHAVSWRVQAMETRTSLARKDFYPDFSVMAGYDTFWGEDELRPSIGFSINVPIQLGRRRAAVREAGAQLAEVESEARRIHRDILLEVHEAFEEVHEAIEGIALYESHLLPAADENLEAARSGYASGEVDFLALVSAQKLVADTRLRSKEFHAAFHMGMAKLGRAIGSSVDDPAFTME